MKEKTKRIWLSVVFVALLIVLLGVSYAYWRLTIRQTNTNKYQAACFSVEIDLDSNEPITLRNAYPMTDKKGMKTEPYTFSITNTCEASAEYAINLEVLEESTLDSSMVKYQLNDEPPQILSSKEVVDAQINNATAYQLKTHEMAYNGKDEYTLRLWLDENVGNDEGVNKSFKAKIVITATASGAIYTDASGAEQPELKNGLIPVMYQDNKWIKTDPTKEWYDYDNQWWANAVTVKEANRSTYMNAETGTEIPMSAINTMWVWIPRYEYKTDNLRRNYAGGSPYTPGEININFISKETTTASAENFLIHPAFTFGTQELSGMWVAKFELSTGDTTCTPKTGSVGTECDLQTIKPTILPNVTPWRGARVGTFWTAIQKNMNGANGQTTYGLTNSDTHMMKNMEWGAVAYLSQSRYGKYGNATYTGTNKEVSINNCSTYVTGVGGELISASESTTSCAMNTYETIKGQAASTTGNVYGIYDMSGGAREYVMGVMKEITNTEVAVGGNLNSNSGFSGKLYNGTDYTGTYGKLKDIDTKYYDVYNYANISNDYTRGYLGDATTEVQFWYSDSTTPVYGSDSWFTRGYGKDSGSSAGIFGFNCASGVAIINQSVRAILVAAKN